MLGKLLSMVVTSGANNPWRPTNQEQFDEMVADKDKAGNYIEYAGGTYRVEPEEYKGKIAVGDVLAGFYFDISKTPKSSYSPTFDVPRIHLYTSSDGTVVTVKSQYLMVKDETALVGTTNDKTTVRQGLQIWQSNSSNAYAIVWVIGDGELDALYDHGLIAYPDKWLIGTNYVQNSIGFIPTYVLEDNNSSYGRWNGVGGFICSTLAPQYAKRYYALSSLTNPASSRDIANGKVAYGDTGYRIEGTYQKEPNPLNPTTEAQYNKLLIPDNIGKFIDYNNKFWRIENISFSGTFSANDSISAVYFDTTKTPTIPDFTTEYEEYEGVKLKYLFKTAEDAVEGMPSAGLFFMHDDSEDNSGEILCFLSGKSFYSVWSNVLIEGSIGWVLDEFGGNDTTACSLTLPEAKTVSSINANDNWNGVYVFKNREVQIDEYIKATN